MPIYEYLCDGCGKEFSELVRSAADTKSVACPKCGGRRVERRFSTFAARSADAKPSRPLPMGGCGRCGDPNGPCGL